MKLYSNVRLRRCVTYQKVVQVQPLPGRQHSFVEIDLQILSTVILSIPIIQERQLSFSGKRMHNTG